MMIGLLLQTVLYGQLMYVYHPMDDLEQCRVAKAVMDRLPNVLDSACVGSFTDGEVIKNLKRLDDILKDIK